MVTVIIGFLAKNIGRTRFKLKCDVEKMKKKQTITYLDPKKVQSEEFLAFKIMDKSFCC